jgi:predicted TPR repeat methyltransferase
VLAHDPADRQGATLRLVRLGAQAAGAMPTGYVQALFDSYAPRFELSLAQALGYCAPDLLLRSVRAHAGERRFPTMLDLGCGTGLAGAAFRPFCDWLSGVELSSAMLTKARAKAIYDRLIESDIFAFLTNDAAQGARYELIVAADVVIYVHALAPLVTAAARVLAPSGLIAFDVEAHEDDGTILRETLRYGHGAAQVREAVAAAGLRLVSLDSAASRNEKGSPVPGLIVVAQGPSS